jgi:hypothetical protein
VLAASVALVVVVVIALLSASSKPARGCLNVDVPGPIGAQEFRQCGTQARQFCGSIDAASGLSSSARQEVAAACRKIGLRAP